MKHILKVKQPYFDELHNGNKTFEIRINDRAFQKGDTIVLYDVDSCNCSDPFCKKRKTAIAAKITFVFSGDPSFKDNGGILPGYVILGLGSV